MKHKKTAETRITRTWVESVTCDICKKRITVGKFEIDEVEIRHRIGDDYPECGSGEETTVDLCGSCFSAKLLPWLESQGAEPTTTEWDY